MSSFEAGVGGGVGRITIIINYILCPPPPSPSSEISDKQIVILSVVYRLCLLCLSSTSSPRLPCDYAPIVPDDIEDESSLPRPFANPLTEFSLPP